MAGQGKKRQRKRKRTPRELDELAIATATLHFERGWDHEKVASELRQGGKDVRSSRDVRNLLERAKERSLIEIHVVPRASEPEVDKALGEALAAKVNARTAIAVRTDLASDRSFASKDPSRRLRSLRESNELHSLLGAAAADHLWARMREDDRIAVGGGRGPAHTVAALGRDVPEGYEGRHEILSLSGARMSRKRASGVASPGAEADHSALNLASLIIDGELHGDNVMLCRLPGFMDAGDRDKLMARFAPHLQPTTKKPLEVQIALIGAGVVDLGHELLMAPDPQDDEIRDELRALRRMIENGCLGPIVNFCDNFYPAPGLSKAQRNTATRIADGLNSRVVTVAPKKLNGVSEKILVAGGRQKLPLFELLADEAWNELTITTLVTDTATARTLLDA